MFFQFTPPNPAQSATPAEAANSPPAPLTVAWYDALIASKQQEVETLFAQFNQMRGQVDMLMALRQLANEEEADGNT